MPNDTPTAYDLWQNQVSMEVDKAQNYLNNVENAFQYATDQLCMAMQTASTEYDKIMLTEASKPFLGDILFGLILDVLPGLKVVARVGAAFKGAEAARKGVDLASDAIEKIAELDKKFTNYVTMGKDVYDRSQGAHSDDRQRQKQAADKQEHLTSRNSTAKEIYGTQLELANKVGKLAITCRSFIEIRQKELLGSQKDRNLNILSQITVAFKGAGLDGNESVGEQEFNALSDKMLYVMLKNYVVNYVTIYIDDTVRRSKIDPRTQYDADATALRTRRLSDLPQVRTDSFIKGLDLPKRTAIYKRFPFAIALPSVNGANGYPGISSYKDLIKYWKPKVVGTSGKVLQFT